MSCPTNSRPDWLKLLTNCGLTSYLWRWRSSMAVTPPYRRAERHLLDLRIARREPRRMVPPMCVFEISGMLITTGCLVASSNSEECASFHPSTFRAYSITATWKPRQMPKYGTPFSRAYCAARIFPSTPRSPNPPGTKMPSLAFSCAHAVMYLAGSVFSCSTSRSCASIQLILILRSHAYEAWLSAIVTEKYASPNDVYLPTTAILVSTVSESTRAASERHSGRIVVGCLSSPSFSSRQSRIPCSSSSKGTRYMLDTSCMPTHCSSGTWQKFASFSLVAFCSGRVERQTRKSGEMPSARSDWTEC
mmetsp:Transcript_38821/g.95980  ORF Transcript_38821/g.95980 Transcript_38821/m.95980 type:complete len:305 (+) Transcript_38821:515-1429(+)